MPWVPANHTTYLGWVGVWSPLLSEADDDVDKPPVVQQPLVGASLWHLLLLLLLHLWRLAAHLTGTGKRTVNFTCGRDSQASKQATHGVDQKAKRSAKQNKTKTRMEHRKKSLSLSLSSASRRGERGSEGGGHHARPWWWWGVVPGRADREKGETVRALPSALSSSPPSNPPPRTRAQLGTKCLPMVCLSFPSASTRFASFS